MIRWHQRERTRSRGIAPRGGSALVGDSPFEVVPFEYLQLFQLGGTVEMPEHGASQLHFVELHAAQTRQPLKSREARLG